MKRPLILIFLFFIPLILSGQIKISGIISDEQLQPISSASISLKKGNTLIASISTNIEGEYMINELDSMENLALQVSHISYETEKINLNSILKDTIINVILISKDYELSSLVVTAKKPAIEFENGNMIINIKEFSNNAAGDLSRLLSRIPGIATSNSDGITLNGKPATIYIDGRKQYLTSGSMLLLLQSMPISSMNKIELISINTGEYDAADGDAIINLISEKQRVDGYYLTLGTEVRFYEKEMASGGSFFYMVKKNNLMFNTTLTYNNDYSWENLRDTTNHLHSNIKQIATNCLRTNIYSGNTNLNWEFFKGHRLNFNFFFYDDFSKKNRTDNVLRNNNLGVEKLNVYSKGKGNDDLWSGNVEYTSPDTLHTWVKASYGIVYGGVRLEQDYYRIEQEEERKDYLFLFSDADMIAHRHTIKSDITHYFTDEFRLMTGLKTDLGSLSDDLIYDVGKDHTSYYPNSSFLGKENIYSGYLQLRYNLNKKWSLMGAARIEHTDYRINHQSENNEIKNSYTDIFPYFHISFKTEKGDYNTTLALVSSISRPNYQYMIPGIRYSNDYSYITGNPQLNSSYNYGVVFNQYFFRFIFLTLRYERISDLTGLVLRNSEFNTDITEYAYDNYADSKRFFTSINLPFQFMNETISGRISATAQHYSLSNLKDNFIIPSGRNNFWHYSMTAATNFQITPKLGINFYGFFQPFYKSAQFDYKQSGYLDAGITYSLLQGDKLLFSLDISDIFNSNKSIYTAYYDTTTKQVNRITNSRFVKFSFLLKFNGGEKIRDKARENQNEIDRFSK